MVRQVAERNPGFTEVVLVIKSGEDKRALRLPLKVELSEALMLDYNELLGDNHAKVVDAKAA